MIWISSWDPLKLCDAIRRTTSAPPGQNPGRARPEAVFATSSHNSNAPIEPVSQSNLSKIIALLIAIMTCKRSIQILRSKRIADHVADIMRHKVCLVDFQLVKHARYVARLRLLVEAPAGLEERPIPRKSGTSAGISVRPIIQLSVQARPSPREEAYLGSESPAWICRQSPAGRPPFPRSTRLQTRSASRASPTAGP